jgi:glycosyltransferase involved in cell wall biosynthesis
MSKSSRRNSVDDRCVVQVIPRLTLAGAERMVEHLSVELAGRGWRVVVASLYDDRTPISEALEASGVEVRYLGKRPGLDIRMVPALRRLVKDERPLAVHSHLYSSQYTIPALAGLGVREFHTVHNMAANEVPPRLQALQRVAFRSGRSVPVAIGEQVQASIRELYGLDAASVPLVRNGVPAQCPTEPPTLPGDPAAFAFLHVGRLAPQKNQTALIRAFSLFHASNPGTKLCILGEGPLRGQLEALVRELDAGAYVFLPGARDDARVYMDAADAFVLPSLYEGMPMTVIEAMMAGLPVLASNAGGTSDMVRDGETGYVCGADVESIAAGLERLYFDERRDDVAVRGRVSSDAWTAGAMADGYEALYRAEGR